MGRIAVNAQRISRGRMPELAREPDGDFYFADGADVEDGVATVLRHSAGRRSGYPTSSGSASSTASAGSFRTA